MLHIAFNSSKELNIYNAVLIYSIVKNTDPKKSFKSICEEYSSKQQGGGISLPHFNR